MSDALETKQALDILFAGLEEMAGHLYDVAVENRVPMIDRDEVEKNLEPLLAEMMRGAREAAAKKGTPKAEIEFYVSIASAYGRQKFYARYDELRAQLPPPDPMGTVQ